jgi:hypothetical protein
MYEQATLGRALTLSTVELITPEIWEKGYSYEYSVQDVHLKWAWPWEDPIIVVFSNDYYLKPENMQTE